MFHRAREECRRVLVVTAEGDPEPADDFCVLHQSLRDQSRVLVAPDVVADDDEGVIRDPRDRVVAPDVSSELGHEALDVGSCAARRPDVVEDEHRNLAVHTARTCEREIQQFVSSGWVAFSAARNGTIAFTRREAVSRLAWIDRSGRTTGYVGNPGNYLDLAYGSDDDTVSRQHAPHRPRRSRRASSSSSSIVRA